MHGLAGPPTPLTRRQAVRALLGASAALPLGLLAPALAHAAPFASDDWAAPRLASAPTLAFRALTAPAPRRVRNLPPPRVTAAYYAIIDEASGQPLLGQQQHTRSAPASTTKIMTALVTLERWGVDRLDEYVPITIDGAAMAARGSTVMGLVPGDSLTMRTLLYGLMLPSGNDAAEQIALAVGRGQRQLFISWMNDRAASLGLQDTHFVDPHGLASRQHYTTAYELATLARAAMLRPDGVFRQLARAQTYRAEGYRLTNLNRLLPLDPGADGVKIGYTPAAGKTMVASATRDDHRVYVGLLRSADLPGDASALLDWAWASHRWPA
jgi:D-alanyl-D-alanine carboxypeptidase